MFLFFFLCVSNKESTSWAVSVPHPLTRGVFGRIGHGSWHIHTPSWCLGGDGPQDTVHLSDRWRWSKRSCTGSGRLLAVCDGTGGWRPRHQMSVQCPLQHQTQYGVSSMESLTSCRSGWTVWRSRRPGGLRGSEGAEVISAVTAASKWAILQGTAGPRTKTCN